MPTLSATHFRSDDLVEQDLPSGRRLVIRSADGAETVEIQNDGGVEVTILLTADGPVIRAAAQRLELEAQEDVSVQCRRFEVRSEEANIEAAGPIRLDGELILLNCDGPDHAASGSVNDA